MSLTVARRSALHRALGDEHRVTIVDALRFGDRTPGELTRVTGLGSNLLAFHLAKLEAAGIVARSVSEGDGRRRYVRLAPDVPASLLGPADAAPPVRRLLFVCSRNASRSQLAVALWRAAGGGAATSAGREPAARIDAVTVAVARERGLDLTEAVPRGYDQLTEDPLPDLIISVCDRAGEAELPLPSVPRLHWSIPDPVGRGRAAVVAVHDDLAGRVARLAVLSGPTTAGHHRSDPWSTP